MPSTTSVQYRARRNAIMRKGYEAALLLDVDEPLFDPIAAKAGPEPSSPAGSPVSIASFFDERMPEIKPLLLPDAWTVVGKGGKPIKKMYDEPLEKKKKKSRKAGKKEEEEEEGAAGSALASLAEGPSSSACLRALDKATARSDKEAARGLQLKHGKQLKATKREKMYAREMLCAALTADGALDDDDAPPPRGAHLAAQPPKSMRARRSPHVEKIRRSRRLASAAARCFAPEEEDVEASPPPRTPKTAPSPHSPWLKVEAEPSTWSALKRKEHAGGSPVASKWAKAASTSRAAKKCAVM